MVSMRGIAAQYILPVILAAVIALAGYLAGHALAGVVVGSIAGVLLAWYQSRRLLQRIALFSKGDASYALPPESRPDELDDLFARLVARRQAAEAEVANQISTFSRQIQLLDMMSDGIMRVDSHGIVTYANVAAGAVFRGRNPTGQSFISVTRDHELNELVQRNLTTGEDLQHTFELPGSSQIFNAVISRIPDTPPQTLVVFRDITEVTRLQMLRRDFVANVSHDLRTPLSAIKIMSETLQEIVTDEDTSHFISRINDEVNVMTSLVNDLLDLASLEGREHRMSFRTVDVGVLVRDVRARMEPIAERHGVHLRADEVDDRLLVHADEQRLTQALINLVTNAISNTPADGRVDIVVFPEEQVAVFEVRDTGVGIHPDDLPRVWERFFRGDRSRTGKGTGLGLAIVKHVVLAHGGSMDARSEPGKGSVFRIAIPLARQEMMPGR
jgi:two-component system phosphate regulon sensor histidine kinase PhoR